jgi:hypothetical protein
VPHLIGGYLNMSNLIRKPSLEIRSGNDNRGRAISRVKVTCDLFDLNLNPKTCNGKIRPQLPMVSNPLHSLATSGFANWIP